MGSYIYALIIYPIEMFIETVFSISMEMIDSAGYAILFVSIAVQVLVLPMYKRADELQDEERRRQKEMAPAVKHIKKTFKGDERVMMLSMYYRFENYKVYYQLRAILPLMLQIPFFMAAYNFLSNCSALDGASFYFLKDMGKPDAMITIGGFALNVMPIAMTLINIISGMIYTRGLELKDKLQLYLTAGVFLVLLYDSPSGLVFYWTLNNVFSLLKNIFLKLVKHPREIASAGSALFVLAYCYKCIQRGAWGTSSGRIVIILVFLIGMIPALGIVLDNLSKAKDGSEIRAKAEVSKEERLIFRISGVVMAITLGIMIPVVTIASSPTEFVVRGHYVNPLLQVLYSFLVATGLFVLWGNIIYNFYSARAKKIMCFGMFALSVCSLINSQFFRHGLNNMSMTMTYKLDFVNTISEKIVNLGVLVTAVIACEVLYGFRKKVVVFLINLLLLTSIGMSGYKIYMINTSLNNAPQIKDDDYYINGKVRFALDKKGNNVVLFMLDRSFGQYLPYILHEKPELKDVYSGFTFYPNTISHGMRTWVGAPALFGGYEYTAYNVKDKIGKEYIDYINDSIKVLPRLFAEEGYKCTVLDPPSFINLDNTTLEDYYQSINPNIDAHYADGVIKTGDEAQREYEVFAKRARNNYLRHSIFISAPTMLREWLYDEGQYLSQNKITNSDEFMHHFIELESLSQMVDLSELGQNTFTIIENDTTHTEGVNLQMPDYTFKEEVDNAPFIEDWRTNLDQTPGNRKIGMYAKIQIQSYGTNMAALLSIGKFIEYLKENDIYDNTRIIIVGDHGFYYFAFDDMQFEKNGETTDLECITPLLMVKDFGDGDFKVSDEFMTNADVPTLALKDLIDSPINPYTGNPINNNQKTERVQYVFDNNRWLSVHDNIYDLSNWDVVDLDFANKSIIEKVLN